jgi:hypothetical protein
LLWHYSRVVKLHVHYSRMINTAVTLQQFFHNCCGRLVRNCCDMNRSMVAKTAVALITTEWSNCFYITAGLPNMMWH